ncbi:uncharacterized protein EMH_0015210 [Eimeria mitis]|uniref:Uncharacterized protein n=1 Tax=Eimeria mitis TaxID=44415 RepID=U6KCM2_9EIME|nr:uncharacterized protein EMH_0015210 [Eimeria mitis]CDJ33233.1 hypothetical protein EMH_0015210 [Eimeria mitis]
MQPSALAQTGALPATVYQPGWGDGGWEVSPEEAALPIASRSLTQIRSGRSRGFSFGVAALAAVAAVAAVYLVFRCSLYLANVSKSRRVLRFLAGSEGRKDKDPGEYCSAVADDPPTAAAAAAANGESGEGHLDKEVLLSRVHNYGVELTRLIKASTSSLLQLNSDYRAKCIAQLLCLSLAEYAALYSVLERRERAGVAERIRTISNTIWTLRRSFRSGSLTSTRTRHLNEMQSLLIKLTEIQPPPATIPESHRLQKVDKLLELQEVSLGQLNSGFFWLREALEHSKKARHEAEAARRTAAAARGAAEIAEAAAAVEAAAAAEVAAAARVANVVRAIEKTAQKRKDQVLNDPQLSHWLREAQPKNHYGITNRARIEAIAQQPLLAHHELLEALKATPLGSGEDPGDLVFADDSTEKQQATTPQSGYQTPPRRAKASPSVGPSSAPHPVWQQTLDRQSIGDGKGWVESSSFSAYPTMSTNAENADGAAAADAGAAGAAAAGAGAAGAAEVATAEDALLQAPSHSKVVYGFYEPNALSQVWVPAPGWVPVDSGVSAAIHPPPGFSPSYRFPQAGWPLAPSGATPVGMSSSIPAFPRPMRRPPRSTFPAAVSAAAAYAPEAYFLRPPGVPYQVVPAYPSAAGPWVPVPTLHVPPGSAASHLSTEASTSSQAGFRSSQDSSQPRDGAPLVPLSRMHPPASVSSSPAAASGREDPVDIFGSPITFREWGLPENAAPRRGAHVPPSRWPSRRDIAAGFGELEKLFGEASDRQQNKPVDRRNPPGSSSSRS